jgi:Flp pilus assembly pilin Flp
LLTTSLGAETDPVTTFGCSFPLGGNEGVWLRQILKETEPVAKLWQHLWNDESGQDIAEYAVMLAVILVIVVGTVRLIGSNANNVFSNVGSAIQ